MDAGTKLCCLIGNPVGHSISPLIHNSISEKMGINMVYTAFAVESDNVVEAVRGAYALGINGMNECYRSPQGGCYGGSFTNR